MPPAPLRALGILAVEIGVALAVTGVLVAVFDDLAVRLARRDAAGGAGGPA